MNLYGNEKDSEMSLRIGTGDNFSYNEIAQFQRDGLLEDFDSFKVSSKMFGNMCVYYFEGEYYLITASHKVKLISSDMLRDRQFIVASRCITNNVQHYGQIHGTEAMHNLSQEELIKIIAGPMYRETEQQIELNDLADELEK